MTLKTAVMMLKIQLCITEINFILKYIQIENIILNCSKISKYSCIFDPTKAALMNTLKNLTHLKLFNSKV